MERELINEADGGENTFAERLAGSESARLEAEQRALRLEAEVACLSAGVSPENTADVIAVAATIDGCESIDEAVGRVIEKYPFFSAGNKKSAPLTTGIHLAPAEKSDFNGVEDAFLRANPGVKL